VRRTRLSEEEIALAVRLAQAGATSEEIDRRLGLAAAADERPLTTSVPEVALRAIAADVFGSAARVAEIEPLGPLERHGVARRAGFTGNLLYRVRMEEGAPECVFRFNRGFREDVYDHEVESYGRVAEATGVRVPRVFRVDRSGRLVPGAYMVLEFLRGEHWSYLCHPANPETSPAEKAAIRRLAGEFFGRLHGAARPAADPLDEARRVLFGLFRLGDAAAAGALPLDPDALRRCRAVVEAEPALRAELASLCLADGEIFFAPRAPGGWEIAFVCDLEWVCWRDRYSDLALHVSAGTAIWELERPLLVEDPDALARDPFFAGYALRQDLDVARLARLPVYHQLAHWGHALADPGPPAQREWLRRHRSGLVAELVELIISRGS
jgi:hypothetical protein